MPPAPARSRTPLLLLPAAREGEQLPDFPSRKQSHPPAPGRLRGRELSSAAPAAAPSRRVSLPSYHKPKESLMCRASSSSSAAPGVPRGTLHPTAAGIPGAFPAGIKSAAKAAFPGASVGSALPSSLRSTSSSFPVGKYCLKSLGVEGKQKGSMQKDLSQFLVVQKVLTRPSLSWPVDFSARCRIGIADGGIAREDWEQGPGTTATVPTASRPSASRGQHVWGRNSPAMETKVSPSA